MTPGPTSLFDAIPFDLPRELIEVLADGPGLRIERIVSLGHTTPEGAWFDQEEHEWVLLLSGSARMVFEGEPPFMLLAGDFLSIPARCRHRVDWTDPDRPTVWLAIYHEPLP
jgi:cupin 2 domain-containing protein